MTKIALILQGGGALGAFEYGVVTKLVEKGFEPVAVTGVSIGAVNAAAIAGAKDGKIVESLDAIWNAITLPNVPWLPESWQSNLSLLGNPNFWKSRTDYIDMPSWTSLCTTAPMYDTLKKYLDFGQINNSKHMRFAVTATSLRTGGPTTFSNHLAQHYHSDDDHHTACHATIAPEHVMASGALPPGFPSVRIADTDYWDGGLFSNTPIDALLNLLEPSEFDSLPIFVVDLFPTGGLPAPQNMIDVQTRTTSLQYQNRFWSQYGGSSSLEEFTHMVEELDREIPASSKLRSNPAFAWLLRLRALKNIRVISSSAAAFGGDHDFSAYGVRKAYEAGRAAVEGYLAGVQEQQPKLKVAA
jgi:predicted acylesterase/phospholipase RssA